MKKWMCYAVLVLWLVAALDQIVGESGSGEERVVQAFAQADFRDMECSVNLAGYLPTAVLEQEAREGMLRSIAAELEMTTGYSLGEQEQEELWLTRLAKEMPQAQVELCMATDRSGGMSYLYVNLDFCRSMESAIYYKKKLEQIQEMYALEGAVSLLFTGVFDGNLDVEARDVVTEHLLEQMGASEQEAMRSEDVYVVYAYAKTWPRYEEVEGKRVNVNVAFSYDEVRDQTLVYLGSPLILENV